MKKYLVFDVESIGLHGEGYAVGGVLYDHQGWELSEFRFACLPEDAKGDGNGRDWVKANAPAIPVTHASPREMRSAFWEVWMKAKKDEAVLVADCGWPVEARFLAACVDDDHTERAWQGPYPMHEAASFLEAAGMDCLGTYERQENELPVHDPLADARQTGRLLFDALHALRPAGDEGLRIKAALAIIEAEGCDCDSEFRDEHTCLAGRIENALAPLPAAPATKEASHAKS